jgi:hypothetical protein
MGKTKDRFQELRERYVDTFHVPNEVFLRSTEYDIYMSTNTYRKSLLKNIKINNFDSTDEVFYKKLKEIKNIPYE